MNIYSIVLNENEMKVGMKDLIDQLSPIQQTNCLTVYSNNVIKINSNFIKFIIKDDHLISKLHGMDIDEIAIGEGVSLTRDEVDFLYSKVNRISGLNRKHIQNIE